MDGRRESESGAGLYEPLEEIIEAGREGLLFPPRDENALVAGVLNLVDHTEERKEFGKSAAARASLTWEDNARRMIEASERALAISSEEGGS